MNDFKLCRMVFFSTIIVCSQANYFSPAKPFTDNLNLKYEFYQLRFTDVENGRCIAVSFARTKAVMLNDKPVYIGVIYSDKNIPFPRVFSDFPAANALSVTTAYLGRFTTEPPNFKWSLSDIGYINFTNTEINIDITVASGVHFKATITPSYSCILQSDLYFMANPETMPYNKHFYWQVPVVKWYQWYDPYTKFLVSGSGWAHMEKDWGRKIPYSWASVQGVWADGKSFAAAIAKLNRNDHWIPTLAYFRDTAKDLSAFFDWKNSKTSISHNVPFRVLDIQINQTNHKYLLNVYAWTHYKTFACTFGPQYHTFKVVSLNSFNSTGYAQLYDKSRGKVARRALIIPVALQFGGNYYNMDWCSFSH